MEKKLLHTPEGVRDIYNNECENKLYLQGVIHRTLKSYGYSDIQTPTFEFFDIFNKEKGSVPSKDLYKFFDREGNTLVLRPDMTPSIARAASKYYMDEQMPLRFCYNGNTFINNAEHQGKLKEVTHIGSELIGDNTSDADAEIIAITIDSLLKSGLVDFQIEVGHADYFKGLVEAANLQEDKIEELKILLSNKNYFGVEELISECGVPENVRKVFTMLPELVGSADVIRSAKNLISNDKINTALDRMEKVYNLLTIYGYEKYVSFDLGFISNYSYYTGIVFGAYTYGTGDAIANGGRYDNLLSQFGKDAPAIGFCINLDNLLVAMTRQKIQFQKTTYKQIILYENSLCEEAIELGGKLRASDINVELIRRSSKFTIEEYENFAKNNFASRIYYINDNETTQIELR